MPTKFPLEPTTPEDVAKLPCIMHPPRLRRFFGRDDVLAKIGEHLGQADAEPDDSLRSLALHGLAGVGKSSIALQYAELLLQKGALDAMFWVHGEKPVTMSQSFTDIAVRLELPDASVKDHDDNRALVLDWLRQTKCRWLIVYDNVESADLLLKYWPTASRGQVLITSRHSSFATNPAGSGLEVGAWDSETASRFLLHLLSTDIAAGLTLGEAQSADEVAEKLDGHALAISHMAGLLHKHDWSIAECMSLYNEQQASIQGVSGISSLNALFNLSFRSLDQDSLSLLGILSFLSPDGIPESLFDVQSIADLPESLNFCADQSSFFKVRGNLVAIALVSRDKETQTLSIHRLVQTAFRYFLSPEMRQKAFDDAAVLISHAFPRRDTASAQMYLVWNKCAALLQHVLSLKDCFRKEMEEHGDFKATQIYCELSNACQRYLIEINAYSELEDLINVNTMALETLSVEDRTVNLQGSLTSHKGQLLVRLGKPLEGVEWLRKSYNIRSQAVPFDPRESSWAAENAANAIATVNEFAEAIRWQESARDHWLEWSEQNGEPGAWPAVLKKSMGTTLIWANQRERARDVLSQAIAQIEAAEPYNWAMAAYTHFALGTLDRHDGHFGAAEAHFMEAQNLWTKGDQLRTDPFNAACMYRMGCTALDQGKLEAAIKHLRDAKVVTEKRKTTMMAEHARCMFKLSEALCQEPRDEAEALQLRDESERLLRIRDPTAQDPGLEKTYDDLVNILWR